MNKNNLESADKCTLTPRRTTRTPLQGYQSHFEICRRVGGQWNDLRCWWNSIEWNWCRSESPSKSTVQSTATRPRSNTARARAAKRWSKRTEFRNSCDKNFRFVSIRNLTEFYSIYLYWNMMSLSALMSLMSILCISFSQSGWNDRQYQPTWAKKNPRLKFSGSFSVSANLWWTRWTWTQL